MKHWQHFPSLRVLVSGFIGFEPTEPQPESAVVADHRTAEMIAAQFNALMGGPNG